MALNKYDKQHLRNLTAYERQVDAIYRAAVKEAAALGLSIRDLDPTRLFSFSDYPITRKRLESLLESLKSGLSAVIVNGVNHEWTLANNKNNELCRQVFGDNVGKLSKAQYRRYFKNNEEARDAFLARKVQGLNLSDRVWKYTNQFKEEIELGLDIGLRSGKAAERLQKDLQLFLQHPDMLFRRVRDEHGQLVLSKRAAAFHPGRGVYRSSYKNARRLAATETNIAYRSADFARWQDLDFVVGIRVVVSNNHTLLGADGKPHKFTDICDELSAPVGSKAVKGQGCYPKDFKFTGWHPHCRCHAETILKTEEEMMRDNERLLRGEEPLKESVNTVTGVPQEFKDWLDDNKERVKYVSSVPYFISDNAKYIPKSFINNIGTLKAGLSEVQAVNVKEALMKIKDPTFVTEKEVKTALTDFATANPSLFNGGLAAVQITRKKSVTAFMANSRYYNKSDGAFVKSKGNTLMITNKDFTTTSGDVFNPLHEVKGAMKAITEKTALTFNQEYALESVWHEFRHAAAVGWKDNRLKTPLLTNSMEVINQFCARLSYPSFIRGLGGKASHAKKIMEKGYGYGRRVSNFCTLLKQMKVSQKSAYRHFQDLIIKSPYEDIHGELIRFVELRGKYDKKKAKDIVCGLGFLPDAFKALL